MFKRFLYSHLVGVFTLFGLLLPFTNSSSFLSQPGILQDTTPPSPVISLNASPGDSPGNVELRWLAPGNDGSAGTASAYIVRYNTVPIIQDEDKDTWTTSIDVEGEPHPSQAGTLESMMVSGLEPGEQYYFSLKSVDEESNTSGVSNIARTMTLSWPAAIHLPLVIRSYDLTTIIPDTTVVFTDSTTQYLESLSDDMTFTFSQWTPELEKLRDEGGIMVGDVSSVAPYGFLRRVKEVTPLCDKVVVTTELATLEEAVETGSIRYSQPLRADQVVYGQYLQGVDMVSSPDGLKFEFRLNDVVLYDNDQDQRTTNDQITADGVLSLEVGVDFDLDIKWFSIRKFYFVATATETAGISVSANYTVDLLNKKIPLKFAKMELTPITVMLGPFPFVFTPTMNLYINLQGEVSVGLSTGVSQQATVRLGAAYEKGHWSGISEFHNQFQFDPPGLGLNASVKVGLNPELALLLYGAMGPYIGKNFYLQVEAIASEADAKAPEMAEISIYAGLELLSGAKITLLGKTLEEYSQQVADYRLRLAHWEFWENSPPNAPSNPIPADNDPLDQPRNPLLLWTGGDPDGDPVTYDVYLETNDPYPDILVWSGTDTHFDPGELEANTDYFWRVVAKDSEGETTAGLVWSFRTGETTNEPPAAPSDPSPAHQITDTLIYLDLSWIGGDPDGDAVTYDVFLVPGEGSPDVLVCEDEETTICYSGPLTTTTTYSWKVEAQDEHGRTSPGPVWSFTTGSSTNRPPYMPSYPYPDSLTNVLLNNKLWWTGGDPDEDPASYDVYLEEEDATPDVVVCAGVSGEYPYCDPGMLLGNTTYYWQVVARDDEGAVTSGPVWMFTTADVVYVPEGEFQMGCDQCNPDEQCSPDELPLHTVYLDDYIIDRTEVTNAEYAACVFAGYCAPPLYNASRTHLSYYDNPEFADYPVLWVDWQNAKNYCIGWTGAYYNLPTEAQWEKAARGSSDILKYPWGLGEPDCSLANHNYWNGSEYEYCVGDTSYVGAYLAGASPYGVLDMSGNVAEWVRDWYGSGYYSDPSNGVNPIGPEAGTDRVVRGGSWFDDLVGVRVARRSYFLPDYAGDGLGFRCVWEMGE